MKVSHLWMMTALLGISATLAGCGVVTESVAPTAHAPSSPPSTQTTTAPQTKTTTQTQGSANTQTSTTTKSQSQSTQKTVSHPTAATTGTAAVTITQPLSVTAATVAKEWPKANAIGGSPGAHMTTTVQSQVQGTASQTLNTVRFVNASVGWIGGNGVIAHTTDGGQFFTMQYHGKLNIQSLDAVNTADVFALGLGNANTNTKQLIASSDGGEIWHTITTPGSVHRVDFLSASVGYVIVGNGQKGTTKLYRTTDGGSYFTPITVPGAPMEMGFATLADGWVYTFSGALYHTTDGGSTWHQVLNHLPSSFDFAQLRVINANTAWFLIAGQGGMSQQSYSVFRTTNGTTWKPVLGVSTAGAGPAPGGATHAPQGPGSDPGPMAATGASSAVVVGECNACGMGTVSVETTSNGGQNWTKPRAITGVQGLPTFHSLSFPTATDGWLVDGSYSGPSTLLHTTDGGQMWQPVYLSGTVTPTLGFSFLTAQQGYGLGLPGDAGAVLVTTDGGESWHTMGNLPRQLEARYAGNVSSSSISFPTATDGYAIGSNGVVYHTTNGGRSFTQVNLPAIPGGYDTVYFANQNVGFAMSEFYPNRTEVTTDGGRHWTLSNARSLADAQDALAQENLAPTLHTLIGAESANWVGAHDNVAWLVGQNGQSIFVTQDGGAQWTNENFTTSQWPFPIAMQFVNANNGWMLSADGSLLRTQDGGKKWMTIG